MDISIPKIWQRVGLRAWQANVTVEGLVGSLRDTALTLVFSWPLARGNDYLKVRAVRRPPEGEEGDAAEEFAVDLASARAMIMARGLPADAIPSPILKQRNHILVADVRARDAITLEFEINTDLIDFLDAADGAADASLPLVHEFEVYAIPSPPLTPADGVMYLTLKPARPMEKFKGYVALDLGNTNSTLVCLTASGQSSAEDIEVVKIERTADAGPVASAVRILKFLPSEDPALMDEASWQVGAAALEEGQGGDLILGAKRLLADSDHKSRLVLSVNGQEHAVPKEFAAELFVCKLFRSFHERKFEVPRSIAITHPTTFSSREVEQLRQAFLRGWRRSIAAELPERSNESWKEVRPALPEMILDEASAAAFYFLYRDFADGPGGPNVMKYLYPDGLNLLVFDCGGGTTDIALIQARLGSPTNPRRDSAGRTAWIEIEVLGRTGHRGFGGDDITTAAFRILKARLAEKLSGGGGRVRLPEDVEDFAAYLDSHFKAIDEVIPTSFDPENITLAEQKARRETTIYLWHWAEQLKIEASKQDGRVKSKHAAAQQAQVHLLNSLGSDRVRTGSVFSTIDMARPEIDALIRHELDVCVDYANKMIEAKLGPGSARGSGEVHCVYLVGNASKYKLIEETIRARLRVPFIGQKLGHVGGDELKESVAKGAALALRSQNVHDTLDIRFDTELANKLPFEITFTDRAEGRVQPLYHEHESYTELEERFIPVPEPSRDASEPHFGIVYLGRRWPGDHKPTDYLEFPFKDPITGPLTVWYDRDRFQFLMRDDGGSGEEVEGVEIQKAAFRAPVQSGKL